MYGRNYSEQPSDGELIDDLMRRVAAEDARRDRTGTNWYRCPIAETTRNCPFGHRWSDDGERAYHHRR